ncbi:MULTISPECIES: ribose-phosphate pyrophosphokinase [unclassified Wenzhouxiangella]|uniref:ribose-phosphate pyrophosphokinase n=1 Tax=unclassified Wenzhouxiangella TaxID=2613841 RepID=UPI000E326E41|nr:MULTISPECIES: ribose-phosphate pyrophosphokinase [unclassified Wenzhouxiangella]RFF26793.1 ribose-phosphate pyrophosphokinase [Wenzhouxiangella sp. 15181]RFP67683.1 ribose-phosphate pyrophosphokinase [Wenzhouxiangella sp. 15190]
MKGREKALILPLPGSDDLAISLAGRLGLDRGELEWRRFPDGESYLRLHDDPAGRDIVVVARLDHPDSILATLLFAADLLREMGARRIGLAAPYLPYMRQDMRFNPGEAVTSRSFARLISAAFDWLVTVDPHLHRYASLDEIYSLESTVVEAAPALADWIAAEVEDPVLIGPDGESEQWVSAVAELRKLPWRVFTKKRLGDRDVALQMPDLSGLARHTPVLVDDIISSGTTMAAAGRQLVQAGFRAPVVVGVHGLFGDCARETLAEAGLNQIVCTNSIDVPEGEIDLSPLLAEGVGAWLKG